MIFFLPVQQKPVKGFAFRRSKIIAIDEWPSQSLMDESQTRQANR
jgi:hypothetical protein